MAQRILFATGGTGGHVYPVASIIKAIRDKNGGIEMELIGTGKTLADTAAELNLPLHQIWSAKIRRYFSLLNIIDIFKLPVAFLQSLYFVWRFMPDIVFAKGGGASFMPALAAKLLFIPLYIHETDVVPGLTNRRLARLANKIFVSFESSKQYFDAGKVELVGNPIRRELLTGNKTDALAFFKFVDTKPVILITGGSQGAQKINNIVIEALIELITEFQVIHLSGSELFAQVDAAVKQVEKEGTGTYGKFVETNYRLYPYLNTKEMTLAYNASDVVISRGGGALFEIAAVGKPVIIIPLAGAAADHQMANAQSLVQYGATVISEDNLTEHIFIQEIKDCYRDREALGLRIRTFARPEVAELIAKALLK